MVDPRAETSPPYRETGRSLGTAAEVGACPPSAPSAAVPRTHRVPATRRVIPGCRILSDPTTRLLLVRIPLSFGSGRRGVTAAIGQGGGLVPSSTRDLSRLPLSSPFSNDVSHLSQWIADDVLGAEALANINSRASAMRLPGIARGRNLLVTSIARNPLVAYRGPAVAAITSDDKVDRVESQPSWTTNTADGSSPELRNAWTTDDLIFYGWSLWRRVNGADRYPLAADHVNFDDWIINADNRLEVCGVEIPFSQEREWTLIPGIHEGILSFGADVLRDGRDIAALVRDRLENPVPDINLEAQENSEDMSDTEWLAFVSAYVANRKVNKGVGFTNRFVKAVPFPGRDDADLMIGTRNASVVDQARIIGVHAGLLDATAPKASLNYETQKGTNQEFVDFDLWTYMLPVAARLSMGDFTPAGQRVAYDLVDLTGSTTLAEPEATTPAPVLAPVEEEVEV